MQNVFVRYITQKHVDKKETIFFKGELLLKSEHFCLLLTSPHFLNSFFFFFLVPITLHNSGTALIFLTTTSVSPYELIFLSLSVWTLSIV